MKFLIFSILIGVANGIHISCLFYNNDFGTVGTHYTCSVNIMDLSDNSTHITRYNGTHISGMSNVNVTAFYIGYCAPFNLTTYPIGLSLLFPNLKVIYMNTCPISTLTGDELNEFPDLIRFGLVWGKLVRVPGNLFDATPNMVRVQFIYNRIAHVGAGLLENLQNLTQADFTLNNCINMLAANASQIPALIEAIRFNCPDNEPQTTTIEPTTTTDLISTPTNQPPRCEIENFEDFVCELDEKNLNLNERVEYLEESNEKLKIDNEELKRSNEALGEEIEEVRGSLNELAEKVFELTLRPCAC